MGGSVALVSVPVAENVMLALPYIALGSLMRSHVCAQLLPQPLNDEVTYGPHSVPGCPSPVTSTSFTFLTFTAGGDAFIAASSDAVVSVELSTVLPSIMPMAYGVSDPLNVIVAVPSRSGDASLLGSMDALAAVKLIAEEPSPLAMAPSRALSAVIANDAVPTPLSEAVNSGVLDVIENDAVPSPLLINCPAASATVKVIAAVPGEVIPPYTVAEAVRDTGVGLRDAMRPAVLGGIIECGG